MDAEAHFLEGVDAREKKGKRDAGSPPSGEKDECGDGFGEDDEKGDPFSPRGDLLREEDDENLLARV